MNKLYDNEMKRMKDKWRSGDPIYYYEGEEGIFTSPDNVEMVSLFHNIYIKYNEETISCGNMS